MNNIENLKRIIEYYGGSATIDEIAEVYHSKQYIIITSTHKELIKKTLMANSDIVRFNIGTGKWELGCNNSEYITIADEIYFKKPREVMLKVFNQNVPNAGCYFSIKDTNIYCWCPKNNDDEWTNKLTHDGKVWEETSNKQTLSHPDNEKRYVFGKTDNGYKFTGLFEFYELEDNVRKYRLISDKVKFVRKDSFLIVCRTTYMKYYDGITEEDKPVNGGSYVGENNDAFEKNNFHKYEDGYCYGFVETKYTGGHTADNNYARAINIANIDPNAIDAEYVNNVRVVFAARSPIKNRMVVVGWYDNATVYKNRITDNPTMYNIKCQASDAHLVPEELRTFEVPAATHSPIGIGQSNFWYIQNNENAKEYEKDLVAYINSLLSKTEPNFFYEPVNLNQWNIFEEVEGVGHEEYFLATKNMKIGDYLILHVGTQVPGYEAGVYAIAKIITEPKIYDGKDDEYCNGKLSVNTIIIQFTQKLLMSHSEYAKYDNMYRSVHMLNIKYNNELLEKFKLDH